jgi:hypothetical protein
VSQVSKTSSSSGTYLCSMQGDACWRWTLGGMFPPRYRVSNCEGYKQGSAWLMIRLNTTSKGMRCNHNLTPKNVIFHDI